MATFSDIIFRIGSKMGPGGLASLQAGIQMVSQLGKAVAGAIKESDKYSTAYGRLTVSIKEAEDATKGLIDTTALITNANKFNAAGMEITSKQLADVAKVATEFAKKTGGDATDAMNELTRAISGGRTFTLKKFNIDLAESTDRTKTFGEAMDKVADLADGMNIELETMTEKFFAIGNQAGTASGNLGHFFNVTSQGKGALDLLNEGLGDVNAGFEDMFDLFNVMGQDFAEAGSLMVGTLSEVSISIFSLLADLPFVGEGFADAARGLEIEANQRLARMRKNEEAFRRRTGRGSVAVGGGRDAAPVIAPTARPGGRRAGGAADDFEGLGAFEGEITAEEMAQDKIDQQIEAIDLRSQEISQFQQLRDMQEEMAQLEAAGVDVSDIRSELGSIATEESNELKAARLDLSSQELDLLMETNAEKIAGLEQQAEAEKQLSQIQIAGLSMAEKGFDMAGRTAGAYFGSIIEGSAMSGAAVKDMIAGLAKNEAQLQTIQGVKNLGMGIAASAMGNAASAAGFYQASATNFVAAGMFGTLAAALGGGGGAQAAPSSSVAGATGPATEVATSAGGGGIDSGNQEIVVVLQGDAGSLFDVVRTENNIRRSHSQDTL